MSRQCAQNHQHIHPSKDDNVASLEAAHKCDHSSGHHQHFNALTDTRRLIVALGIVALFTVIEIIGGLLSGSLALIADAGHMATDSAAIALALWARWLGKRPVSENFPFGLKRAQVLAAFVNGLSLFVLIIWLCFEAVHRLSNPSEILSGTMFVIATLGLAANILAFYILQDGSHDDLNMRGALLHVVGDILGSIAAISAALIIMATGWLAIDPILTVLVCILIVRSAWGLVKESGHILLQGAPSKLDIGKMRNDLMVDVPEMAEIEKLHVWSVTTEQPQLSMHVSLKAGQNGTVVSQKISEILAHKYGINDTTIQVNV